MHRQEQFRFALPRHLAVRAAAAVLLLAAAYVFMKGVLAGEVFEILAALFAFFFIFSLWANHRDDITDTRDESTMAASNKKTKGDANVLVAEFRSPSLTQESWNSAVVDLKAQKIYFHGCFQPRRFFTWFNLSGECPLSEVLDVVVMSLEDGNHQMTIITERGKAIVPDTAENYEELAQLLQDISQFTPRPKPIDDPRMTYAVIGGTTVGLFAGASLIPLKASDSQTVIFLTVGAALGALLTIVAFAGWGRLRH